MIFTLLNQDGASQKKEKKKEKKKRKKKDPNAPKKAASAYAEFVRKMHKPFKESNPGLTFVQLSKNLGVLWKSLSEIERRPYKEIAATNKIRYAYQMSAYKSKGKKDDEIEVVCVKGFNERWEEGVNDKTKFVDLSKE